VAPRLRLGLVAADADFRRFWASRGVSALGDGVGSLALPLVAVLLLGASSWEMGVLRAAATTPALLLSLAAGVWVDRLRRRPVMIVADLGRAALLLTVPLAAALGALRIELLWAVALSAGVLTLLYDLAWTSFVPSLVARQRLVEANGTLQATTSASFAASSGAAGWLVQAVGAPLALIVDAASYLCSAAILFGVRAVEPPARTPGAPRAGMRAEIAEGIALVWRDPILRWMVLLTAVGSFSGALHGAVLVLYAVRGLLLAPSALGIVLGAGALAGVAGAALAGITSRLLGIGGALVAGTGLIVFGQALAPLAGAAHGGAFVADLDPGALVLLAGQILFGLGMAVYSVNQISLRQAMVAPHVLGRVNATRRFLVFGIQPIGALVGGALGDSLGLQHTLVVAAAIQLVALAALIASPLSRVTDGTA
jgi:MFS family permease